MPRQRSGSFYCPMPIPVPQWSAQSETVAGGAPLEPKLSLAQKVALSTPPPRSGNTRRKHVRTISSDADDEGQGSSPVRPVSAIHVSDGGKQTPSTTRSTLLPPRLRSYAWSPRQPSPLRKQTNLSTKALCPSQLFTLSRRYPSFRLPERSPSPPRKRSTLLRFVLRSTFLSTPRADLARKYGLRNAWVWFSVECPIVSDPELSSEEETESGSDYDNEEQEVPKETKSDGEDEPSSSGSDGPADVHQEEEQCHSSFESDSSDEDLELSLSDEEIDEELFEEPEVAWPVMSWDA